MTKPEESQEEHIFGEDVPFHIWAKKYKEQEKERKRIAKGGKPKSRLKSIIRHVDNLEVQVKTNKGKNRLFKMQRRGKPLIITEHVLDKNPDKISYLIMYNKYKDRLELFSYKTNPHKCFISLNGEVFGINKPDWRKLNRGLILCAKFLKIMK